MIKNSPSTFSLQVIKRPPERILFHVDGLLFDALLLFSVFVFLTGGEILIPSALSPLLHQKPWVHRLLILAVTFAAFSLAFIRQRQVEQGKKNLSPLFHFFANLPFSLKFWLWILFFLTSFTWIENSWIRHAAFRSGFDMAIFVQAVWNTLHGRFLYSSIKGGICLLGDHFSPILALAALPYALWTDPRCLLLLQALAAASCLFPIYRIASDELKNEKIACVFCIAFILYLPVRNAVRFDFHPELLSMPILFWAFYFLSKARTGAASLLLSVALLAKENIALVHFAIGFYAAIFTKHKKFGLVWMLVSSVYFFSVIQWAIPYFSKSEYFYLRGNFLAWGRFGISDFSQHLFKASTAAYLIKIFAPLGFLSFLSPPTFLLTVPMLTQNLFSKNEGATRSIFFQYTTFLTPFVFISAIYGSRRFAAKRNFLYYLLGCSIVMAGVGDLYVIQTYRKEITPHTRIIKKYISKIPAGASVMTHEFFAPHLAQRPQTDIYEDWDPLHSGKKISDEYVLVDSALLGKDAPASVTQIFSLGYRTLAEEDGVKLFARPK